MPLEWYYGPLRPVAGRNVTMDVSQVPYGDSITNDNTPAHEVGERKGPRTKRMISGLLSDGLPGRIGSTCWCSSLERPGEENSTQANEAGE
jgi:hypothetical protein